MMPEALKKHIQYQLPFLGIGHELDYFLVKVKRLRTALFAVRVLRLVQAEILAVGFAFILGAENAAPL